MKIEGQKNKAFTLVELAIVLVIVGLITGGVIGGNNLIRAAKVQSQIKQLQSYTTAFHAFKLEYDAIPGDFDEAWSYWGTNCAPTQGECNGNGNKSISGYTTNPYTEAEMFWVHLSLAGLMDSGGYSGQSELSNSWPESKLNVGSKVRVVNSAHSDCAVVAYASGYNIGQFFALTTYNSGASEGAAFSPRDVKKIDEKIDDGLPYFGNLYAYTGTDPDEECVTPEVCIVAGSAIQDHRYDPSHDEPACLMYYRFSGE